MKMIQYSTMAIWGLPSAVMAVIRLQLWFDVFDKAVG